LRVTSFKTLSKCLSRERKVVPYEFNISLINMSDHSQDKFDVSDVTERVNEIDQSSAIPT